MSELRTKAREASKARATSMGWVPAEDVVGGRVDDVQTVGNGEQAAASAEVGLWRLRTVDGVAAEWTRTVSVAARSTD